MAAAKKKKPTAKPAAKKPTAKKAAAKKPAAKRPAAPKAAAPPPKPVVFAPKKSTPVRRPVTPPVPIRVSAVRTAVRNPASQPAGRAADAGLAGNRTDVRTGDTRIGGEPRGAAAPPPVDHGARVEALWARLEAWVSAAGAPALELNPPASEKEIKAAEKALGIAFPADYRASLRLHDGQASHGAGGRSFPWLPGCQPLAPLERLVAEHGRRQKQVKPSKQLALPLSGVDRVKPGLHHVGRIPVAGGPKWDGDTTFLDLEPAPAGTAGQLVTMINKNDVVFVDSSFAAALERWVNVLERGLWSYDRERHAVHPRALVPQSAHPAGWFARR